MQTKSLTEEPGAEDPRQRGMVSRAIPPVGELGEGGTRDGRRYLHKIGRGYWISRRQDHLRLARSARRPIARLTSLLHGWSLRWRIEARRNS